MESYENIVSELTKKGFKQDGDNFTFEHISYNTMSINGMEMKQENKTTLSLKYIGVGGEFDDSDNCKNDIFFFEVSIDGEMSDTVGVHDAEELIGMFRI